MNEEQVKQHFCKLVHENPDLSVGIVAIKTLMEVLKNSNTKTIGELDENLKVAIASIKSSNFPVTAIASGCELFLRFITYAQLDSTSNFEECKKIMLEKGHYFVETLINSRAKIVKHAEQFIVNGSKILTHSRSRTVLQTLIEASRRNKKFHVYVTLSAPDDSGNQMCKELDKNGVSCTPILDSAIAFIMESIDFVMVGAEGVVETGGILNKIGSYTMAVCAKAMNKQFYVLAESFKFTRLYPLNQNDLPKEYKYTPGVNDASSSRLVDYTPPEFITLHFTDLGILTPAAIIDELIKLYL